jgi:hypothetical protein
MTVRLFAVAAGTEDGLLAAIRGHAGRNRAGRDLPSLAQYCHDTAVGTTGLALPVWHTGPLSPPSRTTTSPRAWTSCCRGGPTRRRLHRRPTGRPRARTSPVRERRRRVPNEYLAE